LWLLSDLIWFMVYIIILFCFQFFIYSIIHYSSEKILLVFIVFFMHISF